MEGGQEPLLDQMRRGLLGVMEQHPEGLPFGQPCLQLTSQEAGSSYLPNRNSNNTTISTKLISMNDEKRRLRHGRRAMAFKEEEVAGTTP